MKKIPYKHLSTIEFIRRVNILVCVTDCFEINWAGLWRGSRIRKIATDRDRSSDSNSLERLGVWSIADQLPSLPCKWGLR